MKKNAYIGCLLGTAVGDSLGLPYEGMHPDIEFKNISGEEVNAAATGIDEFRALAEQSKRLFSSRKQTVVKFETKDDRAFVEVAFEAVFAAGTPDGIKAGETIRLSGRSEFTFCDRKIYRINDVS